MDYTEQSEAIHRDRIRDLPLFLSYLALCPIPQPFNIPLVLDGDHPADGE